VKLVGAGYLLYLAGRHFFSGTDAQSRRAPPKALPWMGLTPLWATVVKVELTDIVFAIDSILVAVAMSPKRWVILSGGILGIVTMRLVIGRLMSLVERYPAMVDAAFIIITWVGIKLLVEFLHVEGFIAFEFPRWLALGLIVVILVAAFLYARTQERRGRFNNTDLAARRLLEGEETSR
jgi:YkoY family integral membrane protein